MAKKNTNARMHAQLQAATAAAAATELHLSLFSLCTHAQYRGSSREEAAATDIDPEHADAHLQAVPKISSGAAWQRRAKLPPKVSNFSAEKKQHLAAKEEP